VKKDFAARFQRSPEGDLSKDHQGVGPTAPICAGSADLPGISNRMIARAVGRLDPSSSQRLDPAVRAWVGQALATDLSAVNVHTGASADALARSQGAAALTEGNDVYFRRGRYDAGTVVGRQLLAHELVHVAQSRRSAAPTDQVSAASDPAEREAASLSRRAMTGSHVGAPTAQATARFHRQPEAHADVADAASYRVVKTGIRVLQEGQLAATLGLPPGVIPPGAESNPDFLLSLADPTQASQLVEIQGVPSDVVESLPEGEVVEVGPHHNVWLNTTLAVGEGVDKAVEGMAHGGNATAHAIEKSKVFRVGKRVFLVVSIGLGVKRFLEAPPGEVMEVLGEETGRVGGEIAGATVGVEICVAVGVGTGGIGLLVCGIGGALIGENLGEWLGGALFGGLGDIVGDALDSIGESVDEGMRLVIEGLAGFMDVAAAFGSLPAQMLGLSLAQRERLRPENWDIRQLPPTVQADALAVAHAVWHRIGSLDGDQYLSLIDDPLYSFAPPFEAIAHIADATKGAGPGAQVLRADELLKLDPLRFVHILESLQLTYVQDPDYLAGMGGRWDDEALLSVTLRPLVRDRAEINPANWDLSQLGQANLEGDSFQAAVMAIGQTVWARLGPLPQDRLPPELRRTLKELGVSARQADDVAEGINQTMASPAIEALEGLLPGAPAFMTEGEMILEMTPEQFLSTLRDFGIPLKHKKEPEEIAELSVRWMRSGFQPW
jgi:hypothetical protein